MCLNIFVLSWLLPYLLIFISIVCTGETPSDLSKFAPISLLWFWTRLLWQTPSKQLKLFVNEFSFTRNKNKPIEKEPARKKIINQICIWLYIVIKIVWLAWPLSTQDPTGDESWCNRMVSPIDSLVTFFSCQEPTLCFEWCHLPIILLIRYILTTEWFYLYCCIYE